MSKEEHLSHGFQRNTLYYLRMSTETEIASEVESLKAQFGDTKALYREVCVLLFFRHGITPTASKLYQFVRKGSMSAPAEALAKFWDDLRGKARVEIDHPDMPEEVKALAADAIAGLWRKASDVARHELSALRLELQSEAETMQDALAQATQTVREEQAVGERMKGELGVAREATAAAALELEAERREHTGTAARLQEARGQLEQLREQIQQLQEGFSAELGKVREAVTQADQRAAAAERRALLEIEQERQARAKADKQTETLRNQLVALEAQERQKDLAHAEAATRAQAQADALQATAQRQNADNEALQQQAAQLRDQLHASQQDVTRYRTEAETVQALLQRLSPSATAKAPRRKPTAPT